MNTKTTFGVILLITFIALFSSCRKDKFDLPEEKIVQLPAENLSKNNAVSDYIIAQNYLNEIINIAFATALLTPEFNGLTDDELPAQVRTGCPEITLISSSPDSLIIDFGTGCNFTHPLGGNQSFIAGNILLETYGLMSDNSNKFLKFDEIKINDMIIRFVAGDPANANWIKFINFTPGTGYNYNAFIDGTPALGFTSKFEVINTVTGDSTILEPSYSGIPAFKLQLTNYDLDTTTMQDTLTFSYADLVNACFEIDFNEVEGFYFDNMGNLEDHYLINRNVNDLMLYKPFCRWIYGGETIYTGLPLSNPIGDSQKWLNYGSDSGGDIKEECDGYVRVITQYFDPATMMNAFDTVVIECP